MTPKQSKETLLAMVAVVTVAWLLILGATYVFFVIVRPLGPPLQEGHLLPSSILKIVLTVALGASWFVVMFAVDWLYVRAFRIPSEPS
ncbi:MAG TPA: hypothetical protein VLU99_02415 [Nitrososphaerales archaeon]|nr:hypothetical protein [Nitrososphaerales archaeon]HUK74618.1 hypothetical protein [Nitrososphaerales archaeon]